MNEKGGNYCWKKVGTTVGKRWKLLLGKGETTVGIIFVLLVILWSTAAWLTHVVVCIKTATWGFLIAGAIFGPVAVVHGTGCWFGLW